MKQFIHIEQSDGKDDNIFKSTAHMVGLGFQDMFFPTIKFMLLLIIVIFIILFIIL